MTPREQIMAALFNLVSNVSGFRTASRRLQIWTDVLPSQAPALFMAEREEQFSNKGNGTPFTNEMNVDLYVYTKPGMASGVVPCSIMNPLLDGVIAALAPSVVTGRQTLGGLVYDCRIDGKLFKDPGDMDGEGMAIIPVKIYATL